MNIKINEMLTLFDNVRYNTMCVVVLSRKHFFNIFFMNSEVNASEFIENLEKMFTLSRQWLMKKYMYEHSHKNQQYSNG